MSGLNKYLVQSAQNEFFATLLSVKKPKKLVPLASEDFRAWNCCLYTSRAHRSAPMFRMSRRSVSPAKIAAMSG